LTRDKVLINATLFTVLVFAATVVVTIYVPATGGYFNLGESMIYVAALVQGPIVAAIAGGVGASLADIVMGYSIFAPGTLIIKAIEGYLAGYLFCKMRKSISYRKLASTAVGLLYAGLILGIGYTYLSGEALIGPEPLSIVLYIPPWIWIFMALIVNRAIERLGDVESEKALTAIVLLVAGSTMILGYFLYEYFISNPLTGREPIAALAEIPVNIGQVTIGASFALPIVSFLERAGYVKKSR